MRLVELAVQDWRNLASARLETDGRFVLLHGDNAQGKTNLLEAVWLLATLKSFREARAARFVRSGCEVARVQGRLTGPTGTRKLVWERREGARRLELDGSVPSRLGEWFAPIRAVLFCPAHVGLVTGPPVDRRAFVDRAAFTVRPAHLGLVRDYGRALRHKAALLRTGRAGDAELDTWDAQLAQLGARLAARRAALVAELAEPFAEMHAAIAGGGAVRLRMVSGEDTDVDRLQARLAQRLAEVRSTERRQRRTLVGPQRDDLRIELDGRSARAYASQGQARSLVLALKLAELEAARRRGDQPLFLLDDLTSELDAGRMARLVELLGEQRSQVWITTTDPAHLGPLPTADVRMFRVVGGTVQPG